MTFGDELHRGRAASRGGLRGGSGGLRRAQAGAVNPSWGRDRFTFVRAESKGEESRRRGDEEATTRAGRTGRENVSTSATSLARWKLLIPSKVLNHISRGEARASEERFEDVGESEGGEGATTTTTMATTTIDDAPPSTDVYARDIERHSDHPAISKKYGARPTPWAKKGACRLDKLY